MGPELCSELIDEFREGRSVRADLDGERILAYGTLCNDSFKYLRPKQPTKKTYVPGVSLVTSTYNRKRLPSLGEKDSTKETEIAIPRASVRAGFAYAQQRRPQAQNTNH